MAEILQKGRKCCGKKRTCLFSFSNSVFKRLVQLTCKNKRLFGKGLKAFADDKIINVVQQFKFDLGRVENIMGKGENAGNQCLQKLTFSRLLKVGIMW